MSSCGPRKLWKAAEAALTETDEFTVGRLDEAELAMDPEETEDDEGAAAAAAAAAAADEFSAEVDVRRLRRGAGRRRGDGRQKKAQGFRQDRNEMDRAVRGDTGQARRNEEIG
jgi:hypothetical protein